MGRMRAAAEAVGNPDLGALVKHSHVVSEIIEIYRINGLAGSFINAYSQRGYGAVRLIYEAHIGIAELQFSTELHGFRHGRVEAAILKDVAEARCQPIEDMASGIDRDWGPANLRNSPEIVDAVAMVCVIVRDDDAIETVDLSGQQLCPHVGSAIHEKPLRGAFDQDGCPAPSITRFRGIADAPVIPDPRYACRGAAAQYRQLHAVARENNRKKLSVVAPARASVVT